MGYKPHILFYQIIKVVNNMLYKCYLCDKEKEKTINPEYDNYLKINNRYVHTHCYEEYLLKRKKNP